MSRKYSFVAKIMTAILIAALMIPGLAATSFADDGTGYYQTYEEYQAAGYTISNWNEATDAIDKVLDYAIQWFEEGKKYPEAYDAVNKGGYYGYYETTGFERMMNGISGSRVSEVELQFKTCRQIAKKDGSIDDFKTEIQKLKDMLREDACYLDGVSYEDYKNGTAAAGTENAASAETAAAGTETAASTGGSSETAKSGTASAVVWVSCFSIILREGFEAILIVGAILAYLKVQAGNDEEEKKRKCRPIYIGSLLGIVLSFVLAWLLNAVKLANTASQEIIEGVTALTAVCVLYYVSNWMLSKSESDAWRSYIKSKTSQGSEKGSMLALAGTAFLAVFREGAEVVLFYQPLLSTGDKITIWSGFVFGCICLVIVYLLINYLSIRIPVKPFFTATSILMFIMSVSFLGGGIKELIEGDLIPMTSPAWLQWIPSNDVMTVLGIYPVLETLIPQIILLAVSVAIFMKQTKKNNLIHAEAEAKRAALREAQEAEKKLQKELELRTLIAEVVREIGEGRDSTEEVRRALEEAGLKVSKAKADLDGGTAKK